MPYIIGILCEYTALNAALHNIEKKKEDLFLSRVRSYMKLPFCVGIYILVLICNRQIVD